MSIIIGRLLRHFSATCKGSLPVLRRLSQKSSQKQLLTPCQRENKNLLHIQASSVVIRLISWLIRILADVGELQVGQDE